MTDDVPKVQRGSALLFWGTAAAVIVVDQITKLLAERHLIRYVPREIFGEYVRFTLAYNPGAAFSMRTSPGQGTTVTLRLPLTLAIVRSLLARLGDETYAIPMTHVSETVELHPQILHTLKGREVLMIREEVLPLIRMRQLLGYEGEATRGLEQVVVVEMAERRAALVVDALIGQQEIVVKQFDGVQNGLALFGGATILGDGAPALIIDVSSLL